MYKLKPVLVLPSYDDEVVGLLQKDAADKAGFRPIKEIKLVEPEDCDPICDLTGEDEWTIGDHIRAEGKAVCFALKLELTAPGSPDDYQAAISSAWNSEREDLQRYPAEERNAVYFLLSPRFKQRKRNGQIAYEMQGSWTVSAGTKYLHIQAPGERSQTLRLCVFPTGLLDGDHERMLNELALIDRQLVMAQSARRGASVGERWRATAQDLKEQLDRMEAILRRLEAAPERELVARRSRAPSYKVKKLNAKALMDRAAGRRTLRTDIHEESFDIYEHRMIRTYLENVKKLAGQYRELERRERQSLAGEDISEQAVQNARQRLSEQLNTLTAVDQEFPAPGRQTVHLTVGSDRIRYRNIGGPQFLLKQDAVQDDWRGKAQVLAVSSFPAEGKFPVLFSQWEQRPYLNQLTMRAEGNGRQTCFLCRCVERLTQLWMASHTPFGVDLKGDFVYQPAYSPNPNYQDKTFKIEIRYLDSMEITLPDNRKERLRVGDLFASLDNPEKLNRYLREEWPRFIERGILVDAGEKLFYDIALCNRARFQHDILRPDSSWDGIEEQASRLLVSPVLRGAGSRERLHTSNLFAKHRNYRRAYSLMLEHQTQFAGIDLWDNPSLQVSSTSSLYELWCLLKMLSIWTNDYSFSLVSPPSMNELATQILRHIQNNKNEVSIVLEKRDGTLAGMKLRLDYDKCRSFEENGKTRQLRPDYFLTVFYQNKTYRFCMDAKYRCYAPEQQTKAIWYEDLFHVAWFKYIFRLRDNGNKINGSYILHSDAVNRGKAGGQDMGRYFWSRFDWAEEAGSDPIERDKDQYGILLDEWSKYGIGDKSLSSLRDALNEVEDCRIGSVCFTPHNDTASDAAFRGLMQMIMEHFLGNDFSELYRSKCWLCGSEALQIKALSTRGNFTKYNITCNNCKEFWVQTHCRNNVCQHRNLGKHQHNYYREQSKDSWNVRCPDCGLAL